MPTPLTVHYQFTKKSVQLAVLFATILIAARAHANCSPPAFDAPLEAQLAALPDCQRNPHYLAQLGQLLTAQGKYADALDHLERALMLDPSILAAQLNYAIALAGIGDLLSASQLLDGILSQPDVPPDLRQTLTDARQRIARQQGQPAITARAQPAFALNVNLRYGHDSNLLGTPNISTLALTTPGGVVILPLESSAGPRAGAYTRADIKLGYVHRLPDGSFWDLAAAALQRTSARAPDANTKQTELSLGYSQSPSAPFAGYVSTSWVGINSLGGTRYASQGLAMGLQLPLTPGTCSAKVGLDWQNRNILSNTVLSGHYSGVNTIFGCVSAWGGQWQFSAKIGQDRPKDTNRPGGVQTSTSIRGIGIWPTTGLGFEGTALVDLEYNTTRDATGYSPLLDNAAVRQTRRLTTRFEYQHALTQRVVATMGTEWSGQDANLALFRVKSWGPYAALRVSW